MIFWLDKLEIMRWKPFILNADEFPKVAVVASFKRMGVVIVCVYCS